MEYFMLAILWIAWCFLHSLAISPGVTAYMRGRLGETFRFYRLAYNCLSVITLVPVLIYTYAIQGEPRFRWEGALVLVQFGLVLIAGLLFLLGMRHYDMRQFLGLRGLKGGQPEGCTVITEDCRLDTTGILGVTRHPWYLGGILIVWARDLDISAIITNGIISGYFVVGAFLEERKLVRQYREDYRSYQRTVSMLFPFKWLRSCLRRCFSRASGMRN